MIDRPKRGPEMCIRDSLYTNAFTLYRYGYANAVGVVLAIIIALFSVLQFKTMNTGVEY